MHSDFEALLSFSYEPISKIIMSHVTSEGEKGVVYPLLGLLQKVSINYQMNPSLKESLIEIVDDSARDVVDEQLKSMLLSIKPIVNHPLSCALWFGLEQSNTTTTLLEYEREYTNFRNQNLSHIGIIILFDRLFHELMDESHITVLKDIRFAMVERDLSLVNMSSLEQLQRELEVVIAKALYQGALNGEISSIKLLYEVSLRLFMSLRFVAKKIVETTHLKEIKSREQFAPPAIEHQNRENDWFYSDLEQYCLDDDFESKPLFTWVDKEIELSERSQEIMRELSENFDLLYRAKGRIDKDETVDFVRFLQGILVDGNMSHELKCQRIKARANTWYLRMNDYYGDDQEDILVEQIVHLIAELVSEEVFYA